MKAFYLCATLFGVLSYIVTKSKPLNQQKYSMIERLKYYLHRG